MKSDYEVLELNEGATPEEIKRAYFSLVRAYPPEENPEKFREIREAYEHLKKTGGKGKQQGPVFEKMTDSQALQMLNHIQECQRKGNVKLVRDACEEARRIFPGELQFIYLLAIAQRKAGNTGKAVKNFEELVRLYPQNMWFWKELAVSYMERGFTKKAYGAFEKAYELGCREHDFILMFSMECNDYGQQEMGIKLLQEMIQNEERWERDQMPELLEAYTGLCVMTMDGDEKDFLHILDRMEEDFYRYSVYMDENQEQIFSIFMVIIFQYKQSSITVFRKLKKICVALEKGFRSKEAKEEILALQDRILIEEIYADNRLSDTIKRGSDLFFSTYFDSEQTLKYGWLDVQLCMIEEKEEILLQEEILRVEYPDYYKNLSAFYEELRNTNNLDYIKEKLLKQYIRFSEYMKGGYYFEKYPREEKNKRQGKVFYDTEMTPYVRSEKKVGRNDPCPCGSGKKYKHCCGKS